MALVDEWALFFLRSRREKSQKTLRKESAVVPKSTTTSSTSNNDKNEMTNSNFYRRADEIEGREQRKRKGGKMVGNMQRFRSVVLIEYIIQLVGDCVSKD